jgi:peptidoglycan/LPS O-acetylase OafA/YrhL
MGKAMTVAATRFTVLDSWRGLCALWVAVFHFRIISHVGDIQLIRHGPLAVDFFFVLSGFVLTSAYGGKLGGNNERLRFLVRRIGRLYPLHLVTLLVVLGLETARWFVSSRVGHPVGGPLFTGATDMSAFLPNVVLIHAWGILPDYTWNVPSWSISVEFLMCLLFILASFSRRTLPTLIAMTVIGLLGFIYTRYALPQTESTNAVTRGVYAFFLGCLVHHAYCWWRASDRTIWPWLEWLAIPLLLATPMVDFLPLPTPMFALLIFVFAFEAGPVSRILNHRPMRFLGEISYSLYLVHYILVLGAFAFAALLGRVTAIDGAPWMNGSSPWLGDLITAGYLVAVVGVSALTYRFIEAPGRDWFNRMSNRLTSADKRAAPASPAASPAPGGDG